MSLFDHEEEGLEKAAPQGPPSSSGRVRMVLAYNGAGFHGFALQREQRTVAGELIAAIERVLGQSVEITCAGRTDAGVHARGQVVHFDVKGDVDHAGLKRSLNKMLGGEIVISEVTSVGGDFDARHSAKERRYRYTILNREHSDPFIREVAWHLDTPLDLSSMNLACDPLIGEHDFSSFCRKAPNGASLTRRVHEAGWRRQEDEIVIFEIRSSSFCHQMVRALVGTLVEIGQGRRKAGDMTGILRARDRHAAGQMAPPHGLCLWEVGY